MSELEELIKQIEELRLSMIKKKEGRAYTDPEVIASSQEPVLDKYQEMWMKIKKADRARQSIQVRKQCGRIQGLLRMD